MKHKTGGRTLDTNLTFPFSEIKDDSGKEVKTGYDPFKNSSDSSDNLETNVPKETYNIDDDYKMAYDLQKKYYDEDVTFRNKEKEKLEKENYEMKKKYETELRELNEIREKEKALKMKAENELYNMKIRNLYGNNSISLLLDETLPYLTKTERFSMENKISDLVRKAADRGIANDKLIKIIESLVTRYDDMHKESKKKVTKTPTKSKKKVTKTPTKSKKKVAKTPTKSKKKVAKLK